MTTQTATVTMPIRGIKPLVPQDTTPVMANVVTQHPWAVALTIITILVILVVSPFAWRALAPVPEHVACGGNVFARSQDACDALAKSAQDRAEVERLQQEKRETEARLKQEKREAEAKHEADRREADARREHDRLQQEIDRERERNSRQPSAQSAVYTQQPPVIVQQTPSVVTSGGHLKTGREAIKSSTLGAYRCDVSTGAEAHPGNGWCQR